MLDFFCVKSSGAILGFSHSPFSPLAFDDSAKRRGEGGKRQPLLFLPFSFPHCILSPGDEKERRKFFLPAANGGKKIFPLLFWRRRARRRRKVFYLGERGGGGGGGKKRTGIRRSEEAGKKVSHPFFSFLSSIGGTKDRTNEGTEHCCSSSSSRCRKRNPSLPRQAKNGFANERDGKTRFCLI